MYDLNFKNLILDFFTELNNNYGFKISPDDLLSFFKVYSDFDMFNEEELCMILRTLFCKNQLQYETFQEIFENYFYNRNDIKEYEKRKQEMQNKIESLKELYSIESEAPKTEIMKYNRRISEEEQEKQSFYDQNQEKIDSLAQKAGVKIDDTLRNLLNFDQDKIFDDISDSIENKTSALKKAKEALQQLIVANILNDNDEEINSNLVAVADVLKKNENYYNKNINVKEQRLSKIQKDIKKLESMQHREEFIGGKNAVKSQLDSLYKDLKQLTSDDMEIISKYIKQNANKFKTRISKSMKIDSHQIFDYKRVMKNAIKSNGIPIYLFYKKPKRTKVKIVCIVDVSGSCKNAAQVLLSFVHSLHDVFLGGVETFVFVKDVEKASDVFRNYSIENANTKVSELVRRTYSDYYNAFKMFNHKYFNEITKDTIVLYLGDARNNKNDSGTVFLSRIRDKIKYGKGKMYWLNTESKNKWNTGDSVMAEYAYYMDGVYEILTTNDLIKFLNTFTQK